MKRLKMGHTCLPSNGRFVIVENYYTWIKIKIFAFDILIINIFRGFDLDLKFRYLRLFRLDFPTAKILICHHEKKELAR